MLHSQRYSVDELTHIAHEAARAAGASLVRITAATRNGAAQRSMSESFERGDFTTWGYTSAYADAATDPASILPSARSIICIAVAYATPKMRYRPLHGRVSNYAWSADYHRRMRTLLAQVATALDTAAGAPVTAIACDTKPLAERAFAAQSGLGWIGKHTNLIASKHGSFVFLGEVITTLELHEDVPTKKTCGSCTRCVVACPTQALRGDYTIDATKCIADLTQRTDAIPRNLRAQIGDYVWGCDRCQEVCPPTIAAGFTHDPHAVPLDEALAHPSLTALLRLRSGEFKRRYAKSAMGWRGAAVLRRNAAVALGNTLDRSAIPALGQALREDPHPLVRSHAAWALGRIGAPQAREILRGQHACERDSLVLDEIRAALEPLSSDGR
ncbi:MAG: tRNA epoxyqueuosine(34) reductase QueG [Vulcanimicrobiaceae bacterium]